MASEFYFKKWKETLQSLDKIISIDIEYQESKTHDQEFCDAVLRLSGVLGVYMYCYNNVIDCLQHNTQVHKTVYMQDIVERIVSRILELKEQLKKLEGSCYQYLTGGLIKHKLTPFDVELKDIPLKYIRPANIQRLIEEVMKEESVDVEEYKVSEEDIEEFTKNENWWDLPDDTVHKEEHKGINIQAIYEVEDKISEETLTRKKLLALIQAHEKTRQVIQRNTINFQRRLLWEKELRGTLIPPAPLILRERSAKLIQKVLRVYFEIKRKRVRDCVTDELLGIKMCTRPNENRIAEDEERMKLESRKLFEQYNENWKTTRKQIKSNFIKRQGDNIADDFRDFIRDWMRKWFEEIKFFYALPKENQGGIAKIVRDEVPTPSEWWEEYKTYIEQKKAKKNKTTMEIKWEKKEAHREEIILKKGEIRKKKMEAKLLQKIMKNPNLHPGYHYPPSKKMKYLVEAIEKYKINWIDLDNRDVEESKRGYLKSIDVENVIAEAKEEICNTIYEEMKLEYKKLLNALKEHYKRNDDVMPEKIKEKVKRSKKKRRTKKPKFDEGFLSEKLQNLARKGILTEFPKTNFEDFIGDFNYAGDQLKCDLKIVQPMAGETRMLWWEKSQELLHGFRKILIVGPRSSGKCMLVHILATVNDAVLYNLNLSNFQEESVDNLKELVSDLVICAQATQPSVIYIKHVYRLYYKKTQKDGLKNPDFLKKWIIKRFSKKIHKTDRVTLIGSCVDPWLTKTKQMMRHFPGVVMIPTNTYSTTQLVLNKWVTKNRVVPSTLSTQELARMLQGYTLGQLSHALDEFLTADRVVKIAVCGLSPSEIYEYFLEKYPDIKVDHEKYTKWYAENTHWGQVEKKHYNDRIEFKNNIEKWKAKTEKKKNK